jgi:hypothetical protein
MIRLLAGESLVRIARGIPRFGAHWLLVLCVAASPAIAADAVTRPAPPGAEKTQELHRFAAGGIALIGGWSDKDRFGDEPATFVHEGEGDEKQQMLAQWNITTFPAGPYEGLARDGSALAVTITGFQEVFDSSSPLFAWTARRRDAPYAVVPEEDIALVWTGQLSFELIPPKRRELPQLDAQIVVRDCQARGLEMRQYLGNEGAPEDYFAVPYLDRLYSEDLAALADPLLPGNVEIEAFAASADATALLVGCWYKSTNPKRGTRFRGPVLAYDLANHRVVWHDAIDLDEHLSFIRHANTVMILHTTYSGVAESHGWLLEEFYFDTRGEIRFGSEEAVERKGIGGEFVL